MPVIGRISVGDGATFTPAIDSDGVLTFSNNKNLPNPEPFDVPGAVINSGAMTPGSKNGTIAFGGNDVAVTGWDTKANVASPAFTGTPTAPTPASEDNTTKIATTAYVQGEKTSAISTAKDYTDMEVETGVPTGCVQAFAGQTTPTGWLLCDGSAISRTQYNKLFGVIGTSYGAGDGTDTFNLPDLVDKFVEGSATAGTVKSAGLPNITGSVIISGGSGSTSTLSPSGAFGVNNSIELAKYVSSGTYNDTYGLTFSANKSNSIYGNSNTVQPPALTMRYIIKY